MTSNKDFDDPMFGQSQNVNIQATSEELGFGRTLDVPTSQVKKTIQTCRQICEEVSKRSDLPSNYKFTNRLNYVKEMSSTKEEWWLENVAACGAPDDITIDGKKEVHLVLMSAKEIEEWLLTGVF
eukprot:TRINITY_DN10290_c0_g1_i1.p3 TRINITY_DN10290_c0_g1~~TRINITY_DN10290_c0_g1_i1.p3  ORF type:complete len:125 (-),score=20.38 TRINITY_DN10290_c0_g1_i1:341-715(-)